MATEPLIIDVDPPPKGSKSTKESLVIVQLDVPDRAQSKGWGDMSWLTNR